MIKIILTLAIFLNISASANQKYKQECKNGKMLSCVELGIQYYTGEGVKKDIKKAQKLFKKACKKEYLGVVVTLVMSFCVVVTVLK